MAASAGTEVEYLLAGFFIDGYATRTASLEFLKKRLIRMENPIVESAA